MNVGVLEPGDDAGAADDLGRGADPLENLGLRAHRHDAVAGNGDRMRPPPGGVDRIDVANQHQIRLHGAGR